MKAHTNILQWWENNVLKNILDPKLLTTIGLLFLASCENKIIWPVQSQSIQKIEKIITPEVASFSTFEVKNGQFVASYTTSTPEDAIDTKPSIMSADLTAQDGAKTSVISPDIQWSTIWTDTKLSIKWSIPSVKSGDKLSVEVKLEGWATKIYNFVQSI